MHRLMRGMNVLLAAVFLLGLLYAGDGAPEKVHVVGIFAALVPIILTFIALGSTSRFLRSGITVNLLVVLLFLIGTDWKMPGLGESILISTFLLNAAFLGYVWFRNRREAMAAAEDAAYEPASAFRSSALHEPLPVEAASAAAAMISPSLEPLPKPEFEREAPAANYFARHWRGDLPLPISYWVNGSLLTIGIVLLFAVAAQVSDNLPLRPAAFIALAMITLVLIASLWSGVGVWRSASRHASRGGSAGWAVTAQVVTVLGGLSSVSSFATNLLPQMQEHSLIAFGFDPLGRINGQVTRNGNAVVLSGMFGAGSADDVRRLLDQAPGATTIVLDSAGGRMAEAEDVAALVRARKLNTYVETNCESACTFVLLAGVDRAATPNARIGFHRASFPGMDARQESSMTEKMLAVYRAAGMSESFLTKVNATNSQDMWYPTPRELIDANVINRVSLGGETLRAATNFRSKKDLALLYATEPLMTAMNQRFPGTIDRAAEAAWQAHERGGSDTAIAAASRQVISAHYPKLLKTADEASLRAYLQLLLDQLRIARTISEQACGLLVNSKLDITQVLPPDLAHREQTWLLRLLEAMDQPALEPVDPEKFDSVMKLLADQVSPESMEVLEDVETYQDQPGVLCRSSLEFYEAVRALPLNERAIALRGIFQPAAE